MVPNKLMTSLQSVSLLILLCACASKKSVATPAPKKAVAAVTSPTTVTPTAETYAVNGSLADWPSDAASFSDYQMTLFNVNSTAVLRSTLGSSFGFSFSQVSPEANWTGILLDSEYRFGWILQFANSQVFKISGDVSLGSLNIEGGTLRSSEENGSLLHIISTTTFIDTNANGIPDGIEMSSATYAQATNSGGDLDGDGVSDSADFDIDNDGLPNIFDSDVDNDGISNIFDADSNQNSVIDANEAVALNSGIAIPEIGYKHIFHEIKVNSDDSQTLSLWFVLENKAKNINQVNIISGSFLKGATYLDGSAFSGALFDDGTHGDGIASDGLWSTPILLAAGKTPLPNQAVVFSTTDSTGASAEYLGMIGTLLEGNIVLQATVDSTASEVNLSWNTTGDLSTHAELSYQLLVYDGDGRRIYSSNRLASSVNALAVPFSQLVSSGTFSAEIRALAPSPRNGFPGSSWRSKKISFSY